MRQRRNAANALGFLLSLRSHPPGTAHGHLSLVGRDFGRLAARQAQPDLHRDLDVARPSRFDDDLLLALVIFSRRDV